MLRGARRFPRVVAIVIQSNEDSDSDKAVYGRILNVSESVLERRQYSGGSPFHTARPTIERALNNWKGHVSRSKLPEVMYI